MVFCLKSGSQKYCVHQTFLYQKIILCFVVMLAAKFSLSSKLSPIARHFYAGPLTQKCVISSGPENNNPCKNWDCPSPSSLSSLWRISDIYLHNDNPGYIRYIRYFKSEILEKIKLNIFFVGILAVCCSHYPVYKKNFFWNWIFSTN